MEGLKKSFLVRGNNIVGFSDKNFSTAPIGTVLSFAGQTVPNGYLLADGASYKVADYPDLYAVIGNTYGGDTENFNVPNLVDKFIQGSTTSGTEKEAGLPNITGGWMPSVPVNYQNYVSGAVTAETKSSGLVSSSGTQAAPGAGFKIDASKSSAVYGKSTTVQPPALTMVYIIKAFHTNEGVDSDAGVYITEEELLAKDYADKSYVDTELKKSNIIQFPDGSWKVTGKVDNKRIAEVYATIRDSFSASKDSWSQIGWYPFACRVIEAYIIPYSDKNKSQDYTTLKSNNIRLLSEPNSLNMSVASAYEENQDFVAGDMFYVKIIEL